MSTSASGESGPNGAVGGLDDTGVPGAGECGAGKAYCKRFRRLAAKGDYTGLAFVEEDRERPMATVLAFIERKGFGDKPVAIAVKQSSEGSCTGCHGNPTGGGPLLQKSEAQSMYRICGTGIAEK